METFASAGRGSDEFVKRRPISLGGRWFRSGATELCGNSLAPGTHARSKTAAPHAFATATRTFTPSPTVPSKPSATSP